jgi:hypothetical protein
MTLSPHDLGEIQQLGTESVAVADGEYRCALSSSRVAGRRSGV